MQSPQLPHSASSNASLQDLHSASEDLSLEAGLRPCSKQSQITSNSLVAKFILQDLGELDILRSFGFGRVNHAPSKVNLFQEVNPTTKLFKSQGFGQNAIFVILLHVALGADPTSQGTIPLVFGGNVACKEVLVSTSIVNSCLDHIYESHLQFPCLALYSFSS